MNKEELDYLLYQSKEIKDTLRLTGNIYDCRNEKTAYSRGFMRSEKYINELIDKLEATQDEHKN